MPARKKSKSKRKHMWIAEDARRKKTPVWAPTSNKDKRKFW